MADLWHEGLLAACVFSAASGAGNAAYFGVTAAGATATARRLGAQVLAVANAGAALQALVQLLALGRGEPLTAGRVLAQAVVLGGALATSAVVLRRVLAGRERGR